MFKFENTFELAKNDFKSRYAGNFLGVFWAFLYPCITVGLYWFVFRVILKSGGEGDSPYILWLVSALVPYLFFADCLAGSASAITDYSYMIKKVRLDVAALPAARIISYLFIHGIFLALLLAVEVALGYGFKVRDLWLIYYVAAELVFIGAVGYLLAALTVFFRDVRNIAGVFIQIGYWLTPLFWDINLAGTAVGRLITVINPFSYITEGFRSVILGTPIADSAFSSIYFWGLTAVLIIVTAAMYSRLKNRFADFI